MRRILIKIFNFLFPQEPWPEYCHEPPIKPCYQTDYWKAKSEADEREDARQDEWLNLQYRHEIDRSARDKLCWFIDNPYSIYIGYLSRGVITISRNHDEVFGKKTFKEYVEERYRELLSQTFTDEELALHKDDALLRFCGYNEDLFQSLKNRI
jgi:hypothetical protein